MKNQIKNSHYYKSIFAFVSLLFIVVACSKQEKEVAPQMAEESTLVHSSARTTGLSVTAPASATWGTSFNVTVVADANASVSVSITSNGKLTGETTPKKADSKGNATFKLSVINKDATNEGIGNQTLSFVSNGVTREAKINITIPAGYTYSDGTSFRKPTAGSNNEKIYTTALNYVGNSPASLAPVKNVDTWFSDCDGGDGGRLASAYATYRTYRLASKTNPDIPANPSTTRTSLKTTLSTYQNGNDFSIILTKMASIYNSDNSNPKRTAPDGTKEQDVLTFFGIRAQCKETKDRITKSALSGQKVTQYGYNGGTEKTGSSVRAGMIFEYNGKQHTGIVSDTKFDVKGDLVEIKVIESNYENSNFCNPQISVSGQTPWERTVTNTRTIKAPFAKYRFAEY
jgi:hypothetical protein